MHYVVRVNFLARFLVENWGDHVVDLTSFSAADSFSALEFLFTHRTLSTCTKLVSIANKDDETELVLCQNYAEIYLFTCSSIDFNIFS